eukprot:gene8804-6190_t
MSGVVGPTEEGPTVTISFPDEGEEAAATRTSRCGGETAGGRVRAAVVLPQYLCVTDAQHIGRCPFCRTEPLVWEIENLIARVRATKPSSLSSLPSDNILFFLYFFRPLVVALSSSSFFFFIITIISDAEAISLSFFRFFSYLLRCQDIFDKQTNKHKTKTQQQGKKKGTMSTLQCGPSVGHQWGLRIADAHPPMCSSYFTAVKEDEYITPASPSISIGGLSAESCRLESYYYASLSISLSLSIYMHPPRYMVVQRTAALLPHPFARETGGAAQATQRRCYWRLAAAGRTHCRPPRPVCSMPPPAGCSTRQTSGRGLSTSFSGPAAAAGADGVPPQPHAEKEKTPQLFIHTDAAVEGESESSAGKQGVILDQGRLGKLMTDERRRQHGGGGGGRPPAAARAREETDAGTSTFSPRCSSCMCPILVAAVCADAALLAALRECLDLGPSPSSQPSCSTVPEAMRSHAKDKDDGSGGEEEKKEGGRGGGKPPPHEPEEQRRVLVLGCSDVPYLRRQMAAAPSDKFIIAHHALSALVPLAKALLPTPSPSPSRLRFLRCSEAMFPILALLPACCFDVCVVPMPTPFLVPHLHRALKVRRGPQDPRGFIAFTDCPAYAAFMLEELEASRFTVPWARKRTAASPAAATASAPSPSPYARWVPLALSPDGDVTGAEFSRRRTANIISLAASKTAPTPAAALKLLEGYPFTRTYHRSLYTDEKNDTDCKRFQKDKYLETKKKAGPCSTASFRVGIAWLRKVVQRARERDDCRGLYLLTDTLKLLTVKSDFFSFLFFSFFSLKEKKSLQRVRMTNNNNNNNNKTAHTKDGVTASRSLNQLSTELILEAYCPSPLSLLHFSRFPFSHSSSRFFSSYLILYPTILNYYYYSPTPLSLLYITASLPGKQCVARAEGLLLSLILGAKSIVVVSFTKVPPIR